MKPGSVDASVTATLTLCFVIMIGVLGCAGSQRELATAEPWPEADALFHSEPDWLGGDGAFSIDLGADRSLWLFGDSFIATSAAHVRSDSVMVRNSIAVQTGGNPATASIEFYWREQDGRPSSFFPEREEEWLWPAHGVRVDEDLTLFLSRVESSDDPSSLGFMVAGWRALRIENMANDPLDWELRDLAIPDTPFPAIVGVSVIRLDGHVYAWVVAEPGSHELYLLRWDEERFVEGDLSTPTWWAGAAEGFVTADEHAPVALLNEGATELSVSRAENYDGWVLVQSEGFGATTISLRAAEDLTGPWTPLRSVFRPSESSRREALVYAGKGHPQLAGGDLVVTYATNAWDFADLVADDTLYYPRFVRLTFSASNR